MSGELDPVAVPPAGFDVTVYPVITLPPSLVGAVNATLAERLPAVATTPVGAPATVVAGVTAAEAAELAELPTALVATTVNV